MREGPPPLPLHCGHKGYPGAVSGQVRGVERAGGVGHGGVVGWHGSGAGLVEIHSFQGRLHGWTRYQCHRGGNGGGEKRRRIEVEPVKTRGKVGAVMEDSKGGSPELAEAASSSTLNDMDEEEEKVQEEDDEDQGGPGQEGRRAVEVDQGAGDADHASVGLGRQSKRL